MDLNAISGAAMLLDPAMVSAPSLLRFRAPQSFADANFVRLKASIAHLGGNVQPIKVRPVHPRGYELVFGNLRLQACKELGLPVSALVQDLTGPRQVAELDASNDDNQVSLYERGCLYEAALQAGFFPSRRRLAEALGRELRDVLNASTVAQLPKAILDSLLDPRSLKIGAAKQLAAAAAADPDATALRLVANAHAGAGARVSELLTMLRTPQAMP